MGRATSSINLFGAIRGDSEKTLGAAGGRRCLSGSWRLGLSEIRKPTSASPPAWPALQALLLSVFLEDIDLPVFSLNVTGELRIMADEISEKRCLGVVNDRMC